MATMNWDLGLAAVAAGMVAAMNWDLVVAAGMVVAMKLSFAAVAMVVTMKDWQGCLHCFLAVEG